MSYVVKKKFGQHFLTNPGVIDHIAQCVDRALERQKTRQIVEIGPGQGALTRALLERGHKVLAIEIDPDCVAALRQKWPDSKQLNVVQKDVLEVQASELPESFVAVGNLPYNVGTEIIIQVLEQWAGCREFVWMLQKEVIERVIAEPDSADYGNLAVKFAWGTDCLEHFWVKPGSFQPPPQVESGVAHLRRKDKATADPLVRGGTYDLAAPFVRQAFLKRRKMLRGSYPWLPPDLGQKRPQELSPDEFLKWGLEAIHRKAE